MGLFLATAQAFIIMMGVSLGVMVLTLGFTIFWVRREVKDKIYAYFIEPNNQISRELIKTDGTMKISAKDGGDYILAPSKTKWSKWPPGLPSWAQEIVPTLFYTRNNPEPFDPEKARSILTAQSLRHITDEGMLRATWRDAHEAAGDSIGGSKWTLRLAIINSVVIVSLIVTVGFMYKMLSNAASSINELLNIVKGL